jgi:hypothetical protein
MLTYLPLAQDDVAIGAADPEGVDRHHDALVQREGLDFLRQDHVVR